MPRFCVICGRVQSHSFSVFSFPTSQEKRNAWLDAILQVKPDFLKDKSAVDRKQLKNGVCELHFFRSEISNGKKRRLSSDAVPTIDIPTSEKCSSTLRKYKTFLINEGERYPLLFSKYHDSEDNHIGSNISSLENNNKFENEASLLDCTIEIKEKHSTPIIYKSSIENIVSDEDRIEVCLCCGCEKNVQTLFSILKAKSPEDNQFSLANELSIIFETSQEELISSGCFICRKCLKIVEDILELKYTLASLLSYLKNIFWRKINNNNNNNIKESSLHVDNIEKLDKELPSFYKNIRKCNSVLPSVKKFSCSECLKEFTSLNSLSLHAMIHDEGNSLSKDSNSRITPFHCHFCSQTFSTKSLLSLHLKSHSGALNCEYCGRLITSKSRLNAHLKKFHGIGKEKEKNFRCKSCTKTFSSKGGLKYHELSLHKKGKSLTCEICFKVFTYPMLYKNHKLFVHGDKNILCEICGEMFFTKSKLNIHVNAVHIKALTWSCNICNEKFTTSAFYKHHVSVKHKRIIYSCSQCNAQFRKKNTLVQHMWKHGNYVCPKCNIKFNNTSSFISHMHEIHNVGVSKRLNLKSQSPINNSSVEVTDINKVCDSSKKDDSSVVINDILMASNEFENSTLQTLSFPHNNRVREESSKYDELSNVEPIPFDNVEALEIQTVTNDSMGLEEDVSLMNVQMLQEIEHQNTDIKLMKEPVPSEKQETLSISQDLRNNFMSDRSLNNTSKMESAMKENKSDSKITGEETIKNMSCTFESTAKISNLPSLQLVKSHTEPQLSHIPTILQSLKNNGKWSFSNTLAAHTSASVNTVIRSPVVVEVPPVTRQIDITIPPEEEAKQVSLPDQISNSNSSKLHDGNLSRLSVDIDGKGDVRYVMYFKSSTEKQ